MPALPEKVTLSCQVSFYPLGQADYLDPINRVLALMEGSGLEYDIGPMSTRLTGESGALFGLLRQISEELCPACGYVMTVTLSNVCGLE